MSLDSNALCQQSGIYRSFKPVDSRIDAGIFLQSFLFQD